MQDTEKLRGIEKRTRRGRPINGTPTDPDLRFDLSCRLQDFQDPYHLYRNVPEPAYVEECAANSPSNLASSVTPLARRSSAPAEVSAEFLAGVAPSTMKLAPGSAWNTGKRVGSLTQSCAQATRPRRASTALE